MQTLLAHTTEPFPNSLDWSVYRLYAVTTWTNRGRQQLRNLGGREANAQAALLSKKKMKLIHRLLHVIHEVKYFAKNNICFLFFQNKIYF